jgi:hypothetical protein
MRRVVARSRILEDILARLRLGTPQPGYGAYTLDAPEHTESSRPIGHTPSGCEVYRYRGRTYVDVTSEWRIFWEERAWDAMPECAEEDEGFEEPSAATDFDISASFARSDAG